MYKVETDELFKVISKIMDETYDGENSTVSEKLEDAVGIIEEKLIPTIESISYSKKYDLIQKLKYICNDMFLYLHFPDLIGTNVVGISCESKDYKVIYKHFLKSVLDKEMSANNLLDKIKNKLGYDIGKYAMTDAVPIVIYHADRDDMVNTLNLAENKITLSNKDYVDFLSYSVQDELEISSFIYALAVPCVFKGKSSYIVNPNKVHENSKYYDAFNNLLDIIIVYEENYSVELLKKYPNLSEVYLISGMSKKKLIWLQESADKYNVKIKTFRNLEDALKESEQCEGKNNFCYDIVFKNILCEILWYLADKRQNLSLPLKKINDNLLFKDELSYNYVKELQNFYNDKINKIDNIFNKYRTACNEFLEKINEVQQMMGINESDGRINDHIKMIPVVLELLIKTVKFQSVFGNENGKAYVRHYADILTGLMENKNISNVIVCNFLGNDPGTEQLTEFKNSKLELEFFTRYKIGIYEKLGLSIDDCGDLIKKLSGDLSTNEKYLLALYDIKCNYHENAKKLLFEAAEEGLEDAGKILIDTFKPNEQELKKLADVGVKDAAYMTGMAKYNQNKNSKEALKYLHIAASKKHMKAIKLLGDISYDTYYDSGKNKACAEQAIQYYSISIQFGSKDTKIQEKIGVLYYDLGNYKSAKEYFQTSDTAHSNYMLGTIYESGQGVAVDQQKALKYYETAMQKGHSSAKVAYERLNAKIEAEKAKNTVQENKSYSSYSYYSSSYYSSYYSSGW